MNKSRLARFSPPQPQVYYPEAPLFVKGLSLISPCGKGLSLMVWLLMWGWLMVGCQRHDHHAGHDHQKGERLSHAADGACGHDHTHDHHNHDAHDHDAHDHDAHDHDHHDHDEGPGALLEVFEIPERSQRLLALSFVTASERQLSGVVRFPGRFEWSPLARRSVAVPLAGVVELQVRPPQAVPAGTTLFTLQSPEWGALKGAEREAAAALALVTTEVEALEKRLGELQAAGVRNAELEMQLTLKRAEIAVATQALCSSEAAVAAIRQLLPEDEAGRLYAVAQQAGVVEQVAVVNGAWVETGSEVVVLADPAALWFRAEAPQAELAVVSSALPGFVTPLRRNNALAEVPGRIELSLVAAADTRSQSLYLLPEQLPAWAGLGVGGVLHVVVDSSDPTTLALPQGSIVTEGLKQVVFLRDNQSPTRFLKLEVETGVSEGGWVAVTGVPPGATVVEDGAYELKLVSSSTGNKRVAGHFHADGQFHEGEH